MDHLTFGKLDHKIRFSYLFRTCDQRILVVTDGYNGFLNGSFSNSYFGLSAVIDTLLDQSEYYVDFKLTLAHRQTDNFKPPQADPSYDRYGPNYENFRFTTNANDIKTGADFDIYDFDQIWLFGVRGNANDSQRLDDPELQVLTDWMEKGGGLFATGDHADLGASLCSRVPRASKMRLWTSTVDSDGNAVAPPQPTGANRHDTLVKGHDPVYTFDDESDDVPMKVAPKFYKRYSFHPFWRYKYPHPLLCGKEGVIDILPDHPHEGQIVEENKIVLDGKLYNNADEFPSVGGRPLGHEVVAHAFVQGDHTNTSDLNKGEANYKRFGAIGAYDGYKTKKGRVVVDSTWHHWFDVNLIGRPVNALDSPPYDNTNPKILGFLYSTAGQKAYSRIQNYFINTGLWLAPKKRRFCLLKAVLWNYVHRYPAVERLNPKLSIVELGVTAKDALGRIAGQCQLREWLRPEIPELEGIWRDFNDGCLTCPPDDLLDIFVLGSITRQLLELSYSIQEKNMEPEEITRLLDGELEERILSGYKKGYYEMVTTLEKGSNRTLEHVKSIRDLDITRHLTEDSDREQK
ncbi:MAG: hypothetical protein WBB45_14995 [Cyclobacteriaceae bacterium]